MNRATKEARDFCQRLVSDPEYRQSLETRLRAGTLAPALESLVWAYAYGKPPQAMDITARGPSLASIIAGTATDDGDEGDDLKSEH
jgi:hypothetical protein